MPLSLWTLTDTPSKNYYDETMIALALARETLALPTNHCTKFNLIISSVMKFMNH